MAQPKLRFQRKDGTEFPEWKEKSIGSLCEAIGDGLHKAPAYDINGDYYFINGNNLKNGKIFIEKETPKVSADTIQQSDKRLNSSTILMSINGTIGNLAYYYNENVMLGKSVAYLQVKSNVCKNYIYFSLQTKSIINKFKLSLTGTTIKNLGLNAIRETSIFIPCLEEQQKVADFLSTVDEVMAQSEAEVQNLEQQKKAVMQKIFSREVRFRQEDGTEFPEWRIKKLSAISSRVVRKNKGNVSDIPLTIASLYGLVDQREYFNKTIASQNMEGYYLLKNGEFAYNKSYSKGYDFGVIKRLDKYECGALSTLYICFVLKNSVDSDFMVHYFDSQKWNKEVSIRCAEGARNHGLLNIATDDFFNIEMLLPEALEEQQKIADFLSAFDDAISCAKQELDKWKELKKGLLQQMFV